MQPFLLVECHGKFSCIKEQSYVCGTAKRLKHLLNILHGLGPNLKVTFQLMLFSCPLMLINNFSYL